MCPRCILGPRNVQTERLVLTQEFLAKCGSAAGRSSGAIGIAPAWAHSVSLRDSRHGSP